MLQPYTYCSFTEHILYNFRFSAIAVHLAEHPCAIWHSGVSGFLPSSSIGLCLPALLFYRMEWDTPDRLHTGHSCCQGGPPPSQTGPFTWNPLWLEIWIKVKLFDTFAIRLAQCPPSALPLIRWNGLHWIDLIHVLQSGWSSIYWSTALPLLVHY